MRALSFLALSLAVAGCSVDLGTSTEGENGRVRFAYSGTCFFGCAIDHPVMKGATARISIEGKLPEVEAQSSDLGVLTVTTEHHYACCKTSSSESTCSSSTKTAACADGFSKSVSHSLTVRGHKAGVARLALLDAAGKTVDAIELEVAEPARATLQIVASSGASSVDKLDLSVGAALTLDARVFDAAGRPLESELGPTLVAKDTAIASFDDPSWILPDPAGVATVNTGNWLTTVRLRGRKVGVTSVHVRAGDLDRSFVVTVK